ncbi:hypothetical protein [Peribacillus saganii]|uniref:hypothetical protein n=1 Tax=Peribacillus saganii TaxID=2303992 RepID=UPI001314490A|nr:hypothetical protein [Peribacillus saganii]
MDKEQVTSNQESHDVSSGSKGQLVNNKERHEQNLVCSDELFYNDLRAIVDDTVREHD